MGRVHGRVVAIGAALVLVVACATAWGYWSASGAGSGSGATAAAPQALQLSAGAPAAQLFPGGRSAVAVTVSNPGPTPLRLGSLALDTAQGMSGFGVDAAHASCGVSSLSFTTQTNGGAGWVVPGHGSLSLDLSSALGMSVDAADSCQGAAFTVHLTAGAS